MKKEDIAECEAREILEYLNEKTGKDLNNYSLILNLLREGRAKEDFLHIIDLKVADPFFQKNRKLYNLRTLFAGDRFDTYLAEYRDSLSGAPAPAATAPAAAPEYNFWKLKAAYFHYLKQEFSSLQDRFSCFLERIPELSGYIADCGLGPMLEDVAVHSIDSGKIVLFPLTGINGHVLKFFQFFTELSGLSVETLFDVPDCFIQSEFFPQYYKE